MSQRCMFNVCDFSYQFLSSEVDLRLSKNDVVGSGGCSFFQFEFDRTKGLAEMMRLKFMRSNEICSNSGK